jgi:hypothetical protein
MPSSGTGTVINYGSGYGSDFLTSYGSGSVSDSTSQKVTVPTVPFPVPQNAESDYLIHETGGVWCGEACCWWWRCTATGWPFTHSRPTGWASPTGRPGWLTGSGISTINNDL